MPRLIIRHETSYTYPERVSFGQHRLLLRPRDSHATRVVDAALTLSPPGDTRWLYDALGNCVCLFTPQGESDSLSIVSELVIERYPAPLFNIHNPHTAMPIVYSMGDRIALGPFRNPVTEDGPEGLMDWLRALIEPHEPALDFLLRLTNRIKTEFSYGERYEPGVQSPAETIRLGSGTCRDFAWLMVEALRHLGYAARFVTGYLFDPQGAVRGAGSTHAWCEVFLPDLGWTEFDPTNGLAESADLIPVAVTRTPAEAAPVAGTVISSAPTSDLRVSVDVRLDDGQGLPLKQEVPAAA